MTNDELRHQAISAFESGDHATARNLFTQAAEAEPANQAIWLWLSCLATSDDERQRYLKRVLALDHASKLNQQAMTAFKNDDHATALDLFKQVTQADPNNQTAWLWWSCLTDSSEEKQMCLERVLAINPDTSEGLRARVGLDLLRASREALLPTQPLPVVSPPPHTSEPSLSPYELPRTETLPHTPETYPSQNGTHTEPTTHSENLALPESVSPNPPNQKPNPIQEHPPHPVSTDQHNMLPESVSPTGENASAWNRFELPDTPVSPNQETITASHNLSDQAVSPAQHTTASESARLARELGIPELELPNEYSNSSDLPFVTDETDTTPDTLPQRKQPSPVAFIVGGVVLFVLIAAVIGGILFATGPFSSESVAIDTPAAITFGEDYEAGDHDAFTLVNEKATFNTSDTVAFVAQLDQPAQTHRVGLRLVRIEPDGSETSIFPDDAGFDIDDPETTILAFRLPTPGGFEPGDYTLHVADGDRMLAEGQFTVAE